MTPFDPPVLPVSPSQGGYSPGSFVRTAPHDREGGSQSVQPEREREDGLQPRESPAYKAGAWVESDPYDIPEGSQAFQPEPEPTVPDAPEDDVQMFQDPDDPQYAIITGLEPMAGAQGIAGLPLNRFDTEENDFVIVPQ